MRRLLGSTLALYATGISAFAIVCRCGGGLWQVLGSSEGATTVSQMGAQLGAAAVGEFLTFGGLALLVGAFCSSGSQPKPFRFGESMIRVAFAFGSSFAVGLVACSAISAEPTLRPTLVTTSLIAVGCVGGSWLGVTWFRFGTGCRWLAAQLGFVVILMAGAVVIVFGLVLVETPPMYASVHVTEKDRQRLVDWVRTNDPRRLKRGQVHQLELTEKDLNLFANAGLDLVGGAHQGEIRLCQREVVIRLSLQTPALFGNQWWVNLRTSGRVGLARQQLAFYPTSLQLGRIHFPRWILAQTGPFTTGDCPRSDPLGAILESLRQIEISEDRVRVTHCRVDPRALNNWLVWSGMTQDYEVPTAFYVRVLLGLVEDDSPVSIEECVEAVFFESKRRSTPETATQENSAAILALGYLLGHPTIRTLVGSDVPIAPPLAQLRFRRIALQGRPDWARHYMVSAALVVLANHRTSETLGLQKELLDAESGSGFSFGDLMADRAGTLFAIRATQSQSWATEFQSRIANGLSESDFFPAKIDLPEGLSQREFESRFGGVEGIAYDRMVAEIDRRISHCPLLAVEP